MKGGAKNENWLQQQLFCVDIDNANVDIPLLSLDGALQICKQNNIPMAFYYNSFSHTAEIPKYRLCFVTDEVITDPDKRMKIMQSLLFLFDQADKSCHDAGRIFYGTNNGGGIVNLNEYATYETITNAYVPLNDAPDKSISNTDKSGKANIKDKYSEDNELERLKQEFDFFSYLKERNGGLVYDNDKSAKFEKCEVCGHNNDLEYYKDTKTFHCFGANGNKSGSIIDYIMTVEKLTLKEAIEKFKYELCGIEKPTKSNHPYIFVNDKGKEQFYHPAFVEYFSQNVKFFIIKNGAKEEANFYIYDNGLYTLRDNDMLKAFIKRMLPLKFRRPKIINPIVQDLFFTDTFKSYSDCNPEKYINFKNGLYNLDTGKIEPHTPDIFTTIQIAAEYNPLADFSKYQGGVFDTFMNHFTGNDKSQEQLILEFCGLVLSNIPAYRYKKALVIVGEGNTGKSQILKLIENLIGSRNYYNTTLSNLENERFTIANLYNKRLCGDSDMSFIKVKEISKIKNLTGGDYITGEFKGEKAFNFIFNGLLWFCANELPKFGGDKGDHVYGRFCIVRVVGKTHKKGEQPQDGSVEADPFLLDKMLKEAPYIINKALTALNILRQNQRFSETEKQTQEISEYKKTNSSVAEFFEECIVERQNDTLLDDGTRAMINKVYGKWCKQNRIYAESKTELFKYIIKQGAIEGVKNGDIYYKNFTLKAEILREYNKDSETYSDD